MGEGHARKTLRAPSPTASDPRYEQAAMEWRRTKTGESLIIPGLKMGGRSAGHGGGTLLRPESGITCTDGRERDTKILLGERASPRLWPPAPGTRYMTYCWTV